MKKINFLLLTGLFFMISCTKDNNYPKKFTRFDFQNGEVRLVAKSGEITNNEEIIKFVESVRSFVISNENGTGYVYSFEDDMNFMEENDI